MSGRSAKVKVTQPTTAANAIVLTGMTSVTANSQPVRLVRKQAVKMSAQALMINSLAAKSAGKKHSRSWNVLCNI